MVRIIIAGSRTYNNYTEFEEKMEYYTSSLGNDVVVLCGEAKGSDSMGKMYAIERGWKVESYPAEWDLHGKKAGYIRNKEMAQNATHAIIFWDGESPGSRMMIELANEYKLNLRVIKIKK